jgi:hypothetical protein
MRNREFASEPYEAPRIEYLLAVVEQGFKLTIGEGAGGDENGDDNWDQWD